jgi:hypothetical protein
MCSAELDHLIEGFAHFEEAGPAGQAFGVAPDGPVQRDGAGDRLSGQVREAVDHR